MPKPRTGYRTKPIWPSVCNGRGVQPSEQGEADESRLRLPYVVLALLSVAIVVLLLAPGSHLPTVDSVQVSHRLGIATHLALFTLWSLSLAHAVRGFRDPAGWSTSTG